MNLYHGNSLNGRLIQFTMRRDGSALRFVQEQANGMTECKVEKVLNFCDVISINDSLSSRNLIICVNKSWKTSSAGYSCQYHIKK